jgi:hypothetical protein
MSKDNHIHVFEGNSCNSLQLGCVTVYVGVEFLAIDRLLY